MPIRLQLPALWVPTEFEVSDEDVEGVLTNAGAALTRIFQSGLNSVSRHSPREDLSLSPALTRSLVELFHAERAARPKESLAAVCADVCARIPPFVGVSHTPTGWARYRRRIERAVPEFASCFANDAGARASLWCTPEEAWVLDGVLRTSYDRSVQAMGGGGVRRQTPGWHMAWKTRALQALLERAADTISWEERYEWFANDEPKLALEILETCTWPEHVRPSATVLRPYLMSPDTSVRQRAGRLVHRFAPTARRNAALAVAR